MYNYSSEKQIEYSQDVKKTGVVEFYQVQLWKKDRVNGAENPRAKVPR